MYLTPTDLFQIVECRELSISLHTPSPGHTNDILGKRELKSDDSACTIIVTPGEGW